jgi:hypothetical protein
MTDDVYANAVPYTSPDFSSALLPQPLLKLWLHHQYAMVKFFYENGMVSQCEL